MRNFSIRETRVARDGGSFSRLSWILNLFRVSTYGFRVFPFLAASSFAAEFHPIVDVQTGYLVGSTRGGKWTAAESAKRAVKGGKDCTTCRRV